jgi:hypothetical protein
MLARCCRRRSRRRTNSRYRRTHSRRSRRGCSGWRCRRCSWARRHGRRRRRRSCGRCGPRRSRRRVRSSRLLRRCGLCSLIRFRLSFRVRETKEMLAHKFSVRVVDGTRVRLLFGDADLRQVLDQNFCFDLQLSRQFVDSDLIRICHSPLIFAAEPFLATRLLSCLSSCLSRYLSGPIVTAIPRSC